MATTTTIPQDVLQRLHEANEQFHQARMRLAGVDDMGFEERRELAAALRAAQSQIEVVTREIDERLHAGPAGQAR